MKDAIPTLVEPIVSDIRYGDPADFAARLLGCPYLTFLDSAMRHRQLGRYSYLACDPFAVIADAEPEWPLEEIRQMLERYKLATIEALPPFQGGLAGFLSYELGGLIEPGARLPKFDSPFPKMMLCAYDTVAAFDHQLGKAWIISSGLPESDASRRKKRARDRIEEMKARLSAPFPAHGPSHIGGWSSNYERGNYEAAVARTVEYILDGDIFQANISQRFSAPVPAGFDPYAFYRQLRDTNSATFAAYLDYDGLQIASSSPERLVACDGSAVEARPIKGTVRRDADAQADAALIAELLSSRKDRAENVMIVDLLRNDLSRVCKPGTVKVPVLCGLESYAAVHHLVSVVTGELRDDRGLTDLVAACFPGGSITGAPKIRAMEIIAEIEKAARNIYCGSIGFIGFNGMMDLNICIRTVLFHHGIATFQGGGGITAKSDPAAEYDETLTKVRRIEAAFAAT